jgi:hypothetical protein
MGFVSVFKTHLKTFKNIIIKDSNYISWWCWSPFKKSTRMSPLYCRTSFQVSSSYLQLHWGRTVAFWCPHHFSSLVFGIRFKNWTKTAISGHYGDQILMFTKIANKMCGCLGKLVGCHWASSKKKCWWSGKVLLGHCPAFEVKFHRYFSYFLYLNAILPKISFYKKWPDHRHSTCCIPGLNRDIIII